MGSKFTTEFAAAGTSSTSPYKPSYLKVKEAIDEAFRLAQLDETSSIDLKLIDRLKKAKASGWREILGRWVSVSLDARTLHSSRKLQHPILYI